MQAQGSLRQDLLDHVPVHVRQPAVDAVLPHRQFLVIDAQQVQHRRVDVVDERRVVAIQRLVAPLIAQAVCDAPLIPPPQSQLVNTYGL